MYLKTLTIKGFKSFAQTTTFDFQPGVTAIVGPNGSGKSNVLDALAWVMGEQGVKNLRGGKMEDVIFAGTRSRSPLGRAEVRLTIDNSDGKLPIEYSEVTISRTLFRNGTSEYAINGRNCRLLDVQELLSDSGLGKQMHVIVGQGQLDTVLRATPEDRRGFIEEAAGILKHRRRRERSARKLEAMEHNFTRLTDLEAELRRQLKPLGRQAKVAQQAQTIAAEVRDAKARILADDITVLRETLAQMTKSESEYKSAQIVLQQQVEQTRLRIEKLEQDLQDESFHNIRKTVLGFQSVQSNLRSLHAQTIERVSFLRSQNQTPQFVSEVSAEEVEEAEHVVQEREREAQIATEKLAAASERASEVQGRLKALDEYLNEQSMLLSAHDLEISRLQGQSEKAREKCDTLRAERERRAAAIEQLETRLKSAREELEAFTREHPAPRGDAAEANAEAGFDREYREAQKQQGECEQKREEVKARVHGLEREISALTARIDALTAALNVRSASERLLAGKQAGLLARLAESMKIAPGFEQPVALALGVYAEAVIAQDLQSATEAVRAAKEKDLGLIRLVLETSADTVSQEFVKHRETFLKAHTWLRSLSDCVTDSPLTRSLLAHSYVSESEIDAHKLETLAQLDPQFVLVTDSTVYTAHTVSGGSTTAPTPIELIADRDRAQGEREQCEHELVLQQQELAVWEERCRDAKANVSRAYAQLREADAQLAKIAQQRNRLMVSAQAIEEELNRERASAETVAQAHEEAQKAAEEAQRKYENAASAPRPIVDVAARDEVAGDFERARAAEIEARLEYEKAKEQSRNDREKAKQLAQRLQRERVLAEEMRRKYAQRQRLIARIEALGALLPTVIEYCGKSLTAATVTQQQLEQKRAACVQELTKLRAEQSELTRTLAETGERVHKAEMQSYEQKLALSALLERAGEEFGLTEAVLLAEYGPDQPLPAAEGETPAPYVRAEQEKRLARAERALAELGRINPLALEEFAALEQRHRFLNEQIEDLQNTRKDLLKIIHDLDEKMQDIFADAFVDTREAFAEVFPVLFPGGSGDIALTNPENMLETGIEVNVKPAGKKVNRLSLLSGGERSLAAIAWLISIFQARPSPFYIVDEVEAALDDANLGRLLQVFQKLRENSQLIIITHQKRTMEIADALYGVSMGSDGVSKVVGQRVERS